MACRELCGTHTENRHRRPTKQITRFPSACSLHASPDANNTCGHVDKWRGLFPVQDVYVFLSSSLHPHSSLCASELAVGFAIYFAKTKCQSYYQRSMPCPSLFSLFLFSFSRSATINCVRQKHPFEGSASDTWQISGQQLNKCRISRSETLTYSMTSPAPGMGVRGQVKRRVESNCETAIL